MELWTFINKNNGEIIRCDLLACDPEFGNLYYFVENDYSPYWFVNSEEKINIANTDFVHPQYNSYELPDAERVNLKNYKKVFSSN